MIKTLETQEDLFGGASCRANQYTAGVTIINQQRTIFKATGLGVNPQLTEPTSLEQRCYHTQHEQRKGSLATFDSSLPVAVRRILSLNARPINSLFGS